MPNYVADIMFADDFMRYEGSLSKGLFVIVAHKRQRQRMSRDFIYI